MTDKPSAETNTQQTSPDLPRLGFFALLKEILWAFLGVRNRKGYEQTFQRANVRDIVLVGIFATLLLIATLVSIVYLVISQVVP
ncbi:MAG: DUF2970 domain-containing protein [Immundisolibacteraceae bacterium]|nr:DUF2970 domain-containing protein [Immundisolibacteraceae bacterium]